MRCAFALRIISGIIIYNFGVQESLRTFLNLSLIQIFPALRLTGDYLAILKLGFGEIIRITLNNIDDVLGFKLFYGSKGLKNRCV